MKELNQMQVGIIGLGYVGLPLAVEFAKVRPIIGFDINTKRIDELNSGFDRTDEVEPEVLKESNQLIFSSNINEIKQILKKEGQTEINLIINKKNQRIHFNLQNPRKFDFNQLKTMKTKEYVKKITV